MKNKLNLNLKFNNYHQNSIELNSKINAKVHHNKMNKKSFSSIKKNSIIITIIASIFAIQFIQMIQLNEIKEKYKNMKNKFNSNLLSIKIQLN